MVTFQRKSALGRGGISLEVHNLGMLVGEIRGPLAGPFRYYRGARNDLTPSYEDRDLEALKRKVQASP
jgi:hypothetical protein